MDYSVKIDCFEGPFDLLCHLVQKKEIDIRAIPIGQIIDEYVAIIRSWQSFDLEMATEFLVMAANLLVIKSKILLPLEAVDEEFIDEEMAMITSEAELLEKMEAYRGIKNAAAYLKEKEQGRGRYYTRAGGDVWDFPPPKRDIDLGEICFDHLILAMQELWYKAAAREISVSFDRGKSVREKILEIHDTLQSVGGKAKLSELLSEPVTRMEIVVTFLSLLELARWQSIGLKQNDPREEIVVFYNREVKQK